MMLHIVTWWWGTKYPVDYVARLHAGVWRNLRQPHRFLLMTERGRSVALPGGIERHAIKDPELLALRGCFARLRMFDPGWQSNRGMQLGDRVLSLDLDLVVTGPLDDLLDRDEPLVVLQGVNAANPCPYNCSVFMFRAGAHAELWQDFAAMAPWDEVKLASIPHYEFPDDQGWLHMKASHAAAFTPAHGVYAFRKPGWPKGDALPDNAGVVAFPGGRDPSQFMHLGWVRQHWLGERRIR